VYKRVNIWKAKLNNAGYIVFKSNILRVCKASKTVALHNSAPWSKEWFPYMDIYNLQIRGGRVSSTHLPSVRWPTNYIWPIAECKIREQIFPCPAKGSLGLDSLKKYYGNWRQPQKRGTLIKNIPANFPSSLSSNMAPKYHSDCKDKRVERVIDIIRSAAVFNISVFPRNGFLLGIVRHGGFLPTESVDMDLGMLFSDLRRIQSNLEIPSVMSPGKKIRFKIQNMNSQYDTQVWDGFHPKTNEHLPSHCSIYINDQKFSTGSFFYSYNTSSLFYPMYVLPSYNLPSSKVEQKEYAKHNDGLIVLETGLRGKYGEGRLGKLFDVSAFRKTVPMPFYDTLVDIPIGYKSVLQSFYGDDWRTIKKRMSGNKLETITGTLPPKQICK
jgi:phosphorylcholine metabolism protein LicD